MTGTLTLRNAGDQEAPSTSVRLYLSSSSSSANGALLIKSATTGRLPARASKTIALNYSLPLRETATSKYVLTVIDGANNVVESDESNNTFAAGPL